jgi:hypothetical protein
VKDDYFTLKKSDEQELLNLYNQNKAITENQPFQLSNAS